MTPARIKVQEQGLCWGCNADLVRCVRWDWPAATVSFCGTCLHAAQALLPDARGPSTVRDAMPGVHMKSFDREVCSACSDNDATHFLVVDLPPLGESVHMGPLCEACAQERAQRLVATGAYDSGAM